MDAVDVTGVSGMVPTLSGVGMRSSPRAGLLVLPLDPLLLLALERWREDQVMLLLLLGPGWPSDRLCIAEGWRMGRVGSSRSPVERARRRACSSSGGVKE